MRPEQIRGWTFKLAGIFKEITTTKKLFLEPPLITIGPLQNGLLGTWNKEKRQISLSLALLTKASLDEIIEVFKHEIAHQVVDELFCRQDNRPHGVLFSEACKVLEIPPRASFKLNEEVDKQALKIEKLLALSTSMNQYEAELALAKAQELSFKYNIKPVPGSYTSYSTRPLGRIRKRIANFEWKIMSLLAEFYFVKTLKIFHLDELTDETLWQFEIYGTPHNIDAAEYVYYFLGNNAEELWQQYRQSQGSRVSRMRNSYMNGIFDGFRNKLKKEQELLKQKYAVLKLNDPALEAFFHQCNPRISSRKISCKTVAKVHSDGMREGQKLTVRHGLKKTARNNAGLLLTDKRIL